MTTDTRIEDQTEHMNERQKSAFLVALERIASAGWSWRWSTNARMYYVFNEKGQLLGEGLMLPSAFEAAEGAR